MNNWMNFINSSSPAHLERVRCKILEKVAATVLEEESVKGAYASTPKEKCKYLKKQKASKAVTNYYCRDVDDREQKDKKGEDSKGRKDVRDRLSKTASILQALKTLGF